MSKQVIWFFAIIIALSGCSTTAVTATPDHTEHVLEDALPEFAPVALGRGEKLKVVATTNIVGDVVANVGGSRIDLVTLMPVGSDPHSFEPTPQNVAAVADAHVVFANGVGLEEFLDPLLESAHAVEKMVYVSKGVALRGFKLGTEDDSKDRDEHTDDHGADPHTWTDPNNVVIWTHNIEHTLSSLDPDGAETYATNSEAYEEALVALNTWIEDQVGAIAEIDRRFVTDHATFGYFSDRYGFEMVGAVIPGFSTMSQPSAQELAELQDAIRERNVKAILVGNTVNSNLAQRAAEDTGTRLAFLYTGSLSERDGPASTYIDLMRYNVSQIVTALK